MMKRIWFVLVALLVTLIVNAQDFSYLKKIDLNNLEEWQEAEDAAMECCSYLLAVRYDKKDVQRRYASEFITGWVANFFDSEEMIYDKIHLMTEGRKALIDMYVTCFAMNYIESDRQVDNSHLREKALLGVIEYCTNSKNKLKLTKELKLIKQNYTKGNLCQYFQDSTSCVL